jgi:hypothetical protein
MSPALELTKKKLAVFGPNMSLMRLLSEENGWKVQIFLFQQADSLFFNGGL